MDLTTGKARADIEPSDVAELRSAGLLIEDPRRERPRYFDGRFLAARDLIRDQSYILAREADLGRSSGSGVAYGLNVQAGGASDALTVSAGHGVTPAGELVLIPSDLQIRLADLPNTEQLSARFGLGKIPQPPLHTRTGLFVLALRPVEFTANPVGGYPTSVTGPRSVEDGDIIEATAVVLVPWEDDGAADALNARRGRAAAAIFAEQRVAELSANVLPLAMIAMQNNLPVWIDEPLVRRELGADRADVPGLGYAPRALRLAHLLQHQVHMADVLQVNGGRGFAAREHFPVLPPAGPVPPGMIDASDFTQRYLPPEMTVDFSIVPEDELAALVEEALTLPPIETEADTATLESTSVMILAPVPRAEWRTVNARLSTRKRVLRPAAVNLVASRKPLEILQGLRVPRVPLPTTPSDPDDAEWARLAGQANLWFVRRRNIAYRDELGGVAVRIASSETRVIDATTARLRPIGLDTPLRRELGRASPLGGVEAAALLNSPRFAGSPAMSAAALGEMSREETLDQAAVLRVGANLSRGGAGEGLVRLENAKPDTVPSKAALQKIANGGDWREADAAARVAASHEIPAMAHKLLRPQRVQPAAGEPAPPPAPVPAEAKAAAKKAAAKKKTPAKKKTVAKKRAAAGKSADKPKGRRKATRKTTAEK